MGSVLPTTVVVGGGRGGSEFAEAEAEVAAAEVAAAEVATALGVRWEGAAREAETSRAEAAGLREQLQWEQLQRGRQVEALEVELVAGRGALATAKELVLVVSDAQQEAKVAHGRETAPTLRISEIESRLATASQEGSAATMLRARGWRQCHGCWRSSRRSSPMDTVWWRRSSWRQR